ncbi:hypothetical protein [Chitinophaga sp. sic0106]|uniref:hypothetical protein n=1 Tax=Chitinophaga sp. sic0106 TaxID=2854785 RepID=UPI001C48AE91|nr:hypothetical protein [Chitinophaga sp. sic0106]MBV7534111.1 hypothetical protein [Chitinophaga sp. sic0106]
MQEFNEMPELMEPYPPGYQAYKDIQFKLEQKLASIDEFCQEMLNDRQVAKRILMEIGVLQENGRTTWPYRHLRFPTLED